MKKIALLTIHNTVNYGSALQTFALYKSIEELGYDIELLDYRCQEIENKEFLKISIKDIRSIYRYLKYGRGMKKKKASFQSFVDSYARKSEKYDITNVTNANEKYDVFVTGSDIVWGLNVTGGDYTYFLDFVSDDKKKIAFASSAGIQWNEEQRKKVKTLLRRYDYIAVRESIVAGWISDLIGIEPPVVGDPTMLWTKEKWDTYVEEKNIPKGKYILVYFMDPNNKVARDALTMGKKLGIPVYYINFARKIAELTSIRPQSVGEFLGLIKNAEYVFTASFHALLFSLYFHREVFFYNRANFSRMESLSQWLNLQDHNGMTIDEFDNVPKIDYQFVDAKIEEKREESINLLIKFLGEK